MKQTISEQSLDLAVCPNIPDFVLYAVSFIHKVLIENLMSDKSLLFALIIYPLLTTDLQPVIY